MKKYLIFDQNNSHEYDLTITENKKGNFVYTLYASNNGIWSEETRGNEFLTLTDDGDNISFGELPKKLDYSMIENMRILLKCLDLLQRSDVPQYRIVSEDQLSPI